MNEPFYKSIQEAVDDIFDQIVHELEEEGAYAIFGHSMGSLLAYELLHKIKEEGLPDPLHLFVSGRRPPHMHRNNNILSSLSDEEFLNSISSIGGTHEDFFKNEELVNIFLPILRSDYKMVENYEYFPKEEKLNCNMTFLFSDKDSAITRTEIDEWRNYSQKIFRVYEFSGGHFFIHEKMEEICKIIRQSLIVSKYLFA